MVRYTRPFSLEFAKSLFVVDTESGELMSIMHNPPHPGIVLREYLGEMEVSEAAMRLNVSRTTLSRVLNGRAGISADMSLRLSDALGTHAAF
jgi:addiction module HigA family antidote